MPSLPIPTAAELHGYRKTETARADAEHGSGTKFFLLASHPDFGRNPGDANGV